MRVHPSHCTGSMTDQKTQFDPRELAPFMFSASHNGFLGMKYRDHGEDWMELELPWREDLVGDSEQHVLASGPIISLMDMASGMAIWTRMNSFMAVATLDLRVDYLRPAKEHHAVIGRSQCYHLTRSAAFVRGIAHDGDKDDPVASMAGVFMTIGGSAPLVA